MKPNKINILQGDWVDKSTWSSDLLPHFAKNGFKIFRENSLPFTRLYDSLFWGHLQSLYTTEESNVNFARIDFRHWYYSDSDFYEYVKRVSNIVFPVIMFPDNPYGYERPRQVDINEYEKKLFDRTKIIVHAIKNKHPHVKIVSPSISVASSDIRDRYLEYLMHNRQYFDYYALNCCYDMTEQSTAVLTAFLNELLNVSKKEVWITRWAVPSNENPLEMHTLSKPKWVPSGYKESSLLFRTIFETLESITKGRSKWFFSGIGKDEYHPMKKVQQPIWQDFPHIYHESGSWDYGHFLGLISWENQIKKPILDSLDQLHMKYCHV